MALLKAKYISIWDGDEIETNCVYDTDTKTVIDVETTDISNEYNCCEREFIRLPDGSEIDVEQTDDGEIVAKF